MNWKNYKKYFRIIWIIFFAFVCLVGIGYLFLYFYQKNSLLTEEKWKLEQEVRITYVNLKRIQMEKENLSAELEKERGITSDLSTTLQAEQEKNTYFESQIQGISGMVGTLQKLSQTDRELLKKYSKVYFLSENYIPSKLSKIDTKYLFDTGELQQFHTDALPFLTTMLSEASSSVGALEIVSAYRSFYDQLFLKTEYRALYGSGANQFSADQGYSEHQLGTTVDLTVPKLKGLSLQFKNQAAYTWLQGNAYRFGFILSYPNNNSYYQFEPWHWRFVGVALARKLHDENKSFYDLTQREIDTYLISIFDAI